MAYCQAGFVDYYAILEVSRDAKPCDIKRSYRCLAIKHHPDRVRGGAEKKAAATLAFQRIAEAFQTLGDCDKRRVYDAKYDVAMRQRTSATQPPLSEGLYRARATGQCMGYFQDPFEVFDQFFKGCSKPFACYPDDQAPSAGIDPCDYVFSKARLAAPVCPPTAARPGDSACENVRREEAEYRGRVNQLRRMQAGAHASDSLARPVNETRPVDVKRRCRSWEETEIAEGGTATGGPCSKKPCPSACAVQKIRNLASSFTNAFRYRLRSSFDANDMTESLLKTPPEGDSESLPEAVAIEDTDPEAPPEAAETRVASAVAGCAGTASAVGAIGFDGSGACKTGEEMCGKPLCKLPTRGKGRCLISCGTVKMSPSNVKSKASGEARREGVSPDSSDEECPVAAFFSDIMGRLTKSRSASSVSQADDSGGDLPKKIKTLEDEGFQRDLVIHALEKADGNVDNARKLLMDY